MRIITLGFVYFAVVFGAGFVFGVFRELALTPVYGRTTAVMLEAPFMLVAIVAGAWIAVHREAPAPGRPALFMIGLIGLLLVQVADFGIGLGLRGMSVRDQLDYLLSAAGQLYLGLLAVFLVMPLIVGSFRSAASKGASQRS
jgi:hypothetical protein